MKLVVEKLGEIKRILILVSEETGHPVHLYTVHSAIKKVAGMDPQTIKKYMDHLRTERIIKSSGVDSFRVIGK